MHKIDWLNDSLYQWVCPTHPKLEIILFHDLNLDDCEDVHFKTWESRTSPPICWPQTWLKTEFPHARILCARYDGGITTPRERQMDLFRTAENFMHDIPRSYADFAQNRPICLIGHGFGGLVIKELIREAQQRVNHIVGKQVASAKYGQNSYSQEVYRLQAFINNIEGVFYYGTPFQGTALAKSLPGKSLLVEALEVQNPRTSRLNEWFRDWTKTKGCNTFYILPCRPTKLKIGIIPSYHQVASEASGRYDVDGLYSSTEDDHLSATKPGDQTKCSYAALVDFIHKICHKGQLGSELRTPTPNREEKECDAEIERISTHCRSGAPLDIRMDLLDEISRLEHLDNKLESTLKNFGYKFQYEGAGFCSFMQNNRYSVVE